MTGPSRLSWKGSAGRRRIAARRPRLGALAGCLAGLAGALSACGYTTGLRVAERHESVGLEIFANDSFERDLERPLHDEMSRALRNFSDAPLAEPSRAEAVVRGRIHVYQRRSGMRSRRLPATPDNLLLETSVIIEVEAALYARGSQVPRRGPYRAVASVGYLVADRENELEARDRALRHVAEELVLDLFAAPD